MPISWDAAMDRKLFFAILQVHDLTVDYKAVAEKLTSDEQPCTPKAVTQRLSKIKAQLKEEGGNGSNGAEEGTPKTKATPRKRAVAGSADGPTKKGKAAKAKGTKGNGAENGENEDDEEDSKAKVKKEDADDYGFA